MSAATSLYTTGSASRLSHGVPKIDSRFRAVGSENGEIAACLPLSSWSSINGSSASTTTATGARVATRTRRESGPVNTISASSGPVASSVV
jgi:hypothetical protein